MNWRKFFLQLTIFSAGLLIFLGGGYYWLLSDLPSIRAVETRRLRPSTQILDRHGILLYEVVDPNAGKQVNLVLDQLPPTCVQAILATEDSRFYNHPGIDLVAILRALWQNARAGVLLGNPIVSGGSTLTQQLARNLLMEPEERYEQTVRRKIREAWLAWRLERRYTKNQILALYLDQAYYGNFAYGLEAASQVFFAKPAAHLSRGECSLLAGLIQYPSGYNPLIAPDVAKARQLTVLRLMEESSYIDAQERSQIAAEPLRYRSNLFEIEAPHFVMYVQELLAEALGAERLRDGGLRITTTLDLHLQHEAERSITNQLARLNCQAPSRCQDNIDPNRRVDNAAGVILDASTGEILTMVGSPDYFDERIQGNVNATLTLRQPGSAIKPFTYAAAVDPKWKSVTNLSPLTPASILADLPVSYPVKEDDGSIAPYTPVNYDRTYHGPVSVRTALGSSYNIPTVKVLNRIGVKTLQRIANLAGIDSFSGEHGLALTLGSGEVRLLDLAGAYGIFLNGYPLNPTAILAIESIDDPHWQIDLEHPNLSRPRKIDDGLTSGAAEAREVPQQNEVGSVISPQAAYLITDILSDNQARTPGFGVNSVLKLPFPAAVKTGTTTDWRDNWTMGYTTERIVGVWVGNADNTPMLDVSGVDGAGPIWRDLMKAAHNEPPPSFTQPPGVIERAICTPSGLLPTPVCPMVRRERFIEQSEPTRYDDQFVAIDVDLATGLRASRGTPKERMAQRVYWMLPAEYREWMLSNGIETPPAYPTQDEIVHSSPIPSSEPLVLSVPASYSVFRLANGIPAEHQRIELSGFANTDSPWQTLRLVKDGTIIGSTQNSDHLSSWWTLEAGTHRFWIEGEPEEGGEVVRSQESVVVVEG
ncbi:MAG: transglycosylase domain-containing protein [Chloroflexota bacterium]